MPTESGTMVVLGFRGRDLEWVAQQELARGERGSWKSRQDSIQGRRERDLPGGGRQGLKIEIEMADYLATAKAEDLEELKGYLGAEKAAALQTLDAQATQQAIEKIYERVAYEFAEVKVNAGTTHETTLGKQAGAALFEIRMLAVGKPAPEIAGVDLDNVAFKLSDYKGRVILLDFWGNW